MTLLPLILCQSQIGLKDACARTFPPARTVYTHVPAQIDPQRRFAELGEMSKILGFVGRFDQGRVAGFVWSPAALFPNFVPSASDRVIRQASAGLGRLAALLGDKGEAFFGAASGPPMDSASGVPCRDLGQDARAIVDSLVTGADAVKADEDARLTLSFDSYVTFTSPEGHTRSFALKSARKGGRLPGWTAPARKDDDPRVPERLRSVLAVLRPIEPPNSGFLTLKSLAQAMGRASGITLQIDRRIEEDRIYVRPGTDAGARMSDQALGIACATDMVWRKVGRAYILAISAQDPRVELLRRFREGSASATRGFVKAIGELRLLPEGMSGQDLYRAPRPLGTLSASELEGLAACVDFSRPEDEAQFRAISTDLAFRGGTVKFQGLGFATLFSASNHATVGGTVVRFGGD